MTRLINGHFAKGNAGGPGNPFSKAVKRLRVAIHKHATDKRIRNVIHSLYRSALLNNDTAAAKEYLDRCLGKAPQHISVESAAQAITDEDWIKFYESVGVPRDKWAPHILAKLKAGRIVVESTEVKELPS